MLNTICGFDLRLSQGQFIHLKVRKHEYVRTDGGSLTGELGTEYDGDNLRKE